MTCVIHVGRVDWSEEQTMRAVQLTAYGSPGEGLKFVDIPEPVPPRANQVLLGIEYSPINMSDLLVAYGVYPLRPTLPTVIGNEGVGRVLAVGPGVQSVKVGDRVLAPLNSSAWTERLVVPADDLFALPPDADVQQLAMLGINPPTAALLLSEFVDLKAGDWVVQNAANSGVGRAVIAFAKKRGLRTVNLVRREEVVGELKALGGDLIFKGVVVRGFWLGDPAHAAKIQPVLEEAARMVRAGQLRVPVAATYPLSAIKDAVAHVQRGGKVLLEIAAAR